MTESNTVQQRSPEASTRKEALEKIFPGAFHLIEMIASNPRNSTGYDDFFSHAEKLDAFDPNAEDQNYQLLVGSILAIPEAIQELSKHEAFSPEDLFFRRQIKRGLADLQGIYKAYQTDNQVDFDRNYVLLVLGCYSFDVFEGCFIISEALEHFRLDYKDEDLLTTLTNLYQRFHKETEYARGTNGRVLLQSLLAGIKTLRDFWYKASPAQQVEMLSYLETMKDKIIPLLNLPLHRDLEQFKTAFNNLKKISKQILDDLKRSEVG